MESRILLHDQAPRLPLKHAFLNPFIHPFALECFMGPGYGLGEESIWKKAKGEV